jgi:hypothetical protein
MPSKVIIKNLNSIYLHVGFVLKSPPKWVNKRGEICSLGEMFTPSFTPRGEHSLLFRRMEGQTENFTPRG